MRIEASLSQRDGLGPGVMVVAALPEPKLLSIAVTITVCAALPAGRWKIGFVPVLASTWWSPSMSHSKATMCVPGGGIVSWASIVATPPACGWPEGTASTTTGLGGGAAVGAGPAVAVGVGCGGAGSGNATAGAHAHGEAALDAVAAPVAGVRRRGIGVRGVGQEVPGAVEVGRLAERRPAEGRQATRDDGGIEREGEGLQAVGDRRGHGGLRAGELAGQVLAVGGRQRVVELAQLDVQSLAVRVAGRDDLLVGESVPAGVHQHVHVDRRERVVVEAHRQRRRRAGHVPGDLPEISLCARGAGGV